MCVDAATDDLIFGSVDNASLYVVRTSGVPKGGYGFQLHHC